MRHVYGLLVLLSFVLATQAQDPVDNFLLTFWSKPYVGPDGLVLRSIEDNVTAEKWPEAKQLAYAQYPLAVVMPSASIPMTAADAYALLKDQSQPIAIGHRWVKSARKTAGHPPELRRIVLWLEPRPKYLNDDEINAGVTRGDFESLFPPYPIGVFTGVDGFRLGGRYVNFPIPTISTSLSPNGAPPNGPRGEVRPIDAFVHLYSSWALPEADLVTREIESALEALGNGGGKNGGIAVVQTASGVVLKHGGTQFGHVGYCWVSGGNRFQINILGKAPGVLEAFVHQQPSALPRDLEITDANVGTLSLRFGLARLRAAPPVLEDDSRMIRIQPFQNRDQFQRGINLLKVFKDLWPVIYGYDKARRARYDQHLSPESKVFSWQSYIDEETAARAEVIAAVTTFAEQAERRGLLRQEKVSRRPWADWAEDALPPCYVLGPEK